MIRKNYDTNKGAILIEIIVIMLLVSFICSSLASLSYQKIILNKSDSTNQQLYLSAKSVVSVISTYFELEENKGELEKYAKANGFKGSKAEFNISEKEIADKAFVQIELKGSLPPDDQYAKIIVEVFDKDGNSAKTYCYMKF